MISPIIGPDFTKSADLSGGRNGTGLETGSLVQRVNNDPTNAISSANQLIGDIEKAPILSQIHLGTIADNILGSQAKDENGNIIADTYQANGLIGKNQQRESVKLANERKMNFINENIAKADEKGQQLANEWNTESNILKALNQSITDKADAQIQQSFGNVGTFNDVKDNLDNYFLNAVGLDRKMAVEGWRTGGNNSQVWNELVGSKKMSQQDFDKLMAYANKVSNVETDKNNALNGNLDRNQTQQLLEATRQGLIGLGYNDVQSSHLASAGVQIGVGNLEKSKLGLEFMSFNNRLEKGQMQAQAIALQKQLDEQKRTNDALIGLQAERNKILAQQANQQGQQGDNTNLTPESINGLEVVDWQNAENFNGNSNQIYIEFKNGRKVFAPKGMFTLGNDGKTLQKVDGYTGDMNILELNENRMSIADEDKMIRRVQKQLNEYANIMDKNPEASVQYKNAKRDAQNAINEVLKYMGAPEGQNLFSLRGDLTTNDFATDIASSGKFMLSKANEFFGKGVTSLREQANILPEVMQKYRTETPKEVSTFSKIFSLGRTAFDDNAEYVQSVKGVKDTTTRNKLMDEINTLNEQPQQEIPKIDQILTKYGNDKTNIAEKISIMKDLALNGQDEATRQTAKQDYVRVTTQSKTMGDFINKTDEGSKRLLSLQGQGSQIATLLGKESYAELDDKAVQTTMNLAALLAATNPTIAKDKNEMDNFIKMGYNALEFASKDNGAKFAKDVKNYSDKFSGKLIQGININTAISLVELKPILNKLLNAKTTGEVVNIILESKPNSYTIK